MFFSKTIYNIKELIVHRDVFLNILICIIWGSMLLSYLRGIINHLPVLNEYTDEIEVACVVVPLILSLPVLISRFTLFDYTFFLSLAVYYGFNYAIHPENITALNKHAFEALCICFPMYFIGRVIDVRKYFDAFTIVSALCILMSLFYFLAYAQQNKNMSDVASDDNMHTAYRTLPHVIMLAWASMRRFNLIYTGLAIMGLLFLLSCGTRGPLGCLGVFCIIYFLFFMNFRYAYIIKGIIITIIGILLVFIHDILFYLVYTFTNLKLSTRIIDKFISGEIGDDSGRATLQASLQNYLDNYGNFFGLGFYGAERYGYVYSHAIALDFFISFGYVLGFLLLTAMCLLLAAAFIKADTTDKRAFILLISCFTIVKFFLSGTFLTEPFFYVLIGYCVTIVITSKPNTCKIK